MWHRIAADAVVVVHLLAIGLIVFGALGWLRYRWWPALHLPTAIYGVAIEWIGWTCPLTSLENSLRHAAGQQGYAGGFVDHYIVPLIYPANFTDQLALVLGGLVLAINLLLYGWIAWRRNRHRHQRQP